MLLLLQKRLAGRRSLGWLRAHREDFVAGMCSLLGPVPSWASGYWFQDKLQHEPGMVPAQMSKNSFKISWL